jgi:uncharacterized phage-associated protein
MKLKKLKVKKFRHSDEFGEVIIPDVEILFDPKENEITAESFDQKRHEYSISSTEIDRLSAISAQSFYDENIKQILAGKKVLSAKEIRGIKDFLKLSGAAFGNLVGLDKSSISRLMSKNQNPQRDKMILMMDRLCEELEHPGINKIRLDQQVTTGKRLNIENICLSAHIVAEYFVRKFLKTEGPITHLKLQKLLYYAQGIGFGRCDLKLINEPFLAWEHGPVIKEVYVLYKAQDRNPLPQNPDISLEELMKRDDLVDILEETVSLYGVYDAWYLREKTHGEKPWRETPRDTVIKDELMISFFKKVLV